VGAFGPAVESGDITRISAALADDVTFRSPAVHAPYSGRDTVTFILSAVVQVFEHFTYVGTIRDDSQEMLRFRARVGEREIDGVDIVTYDDSGQVAELTVMIRPYSALTAVKDAMAAALAAAKPA